MFIFVASPFKKVPKSHTPFPPLYPPHESKRIGENINKKSRHARKEKKKKVWRWKQFESALPGIKFVRLPSLSCLSYHTLHKNGYVLSW